MDTVKQLGLWSSLGSHGYNVSISVVSLFAQAGETSPDEVLTLTLKLILMVDANHSPNNTNINQYVLPSGPNLLILTSMGDELWRGQTRG